MTTKGHALQIFEDLTRRYRDRVFYDISKDLFVLQNDNNYESVDNVKEFVADETGYPLDIVKQWFLLRGLPSKESVRLEKYYNVRVERERVIGCKPDEVLRVYEFARLRTR